MLEKAIFLNVSYGNASAFSDFDIYISAEALLALRILHICFVHNHINYLKFRDIVEKKAKLLTLSLALHTIYKVNVKKLEILRSLQA